MADPEAQKAHKRVAIGAILAGLTTVLVYGLWRIAATFDSPTGFEGWLWLAFESAVMLGTVPVFLAILLADGAWLVFKGTGALVQSIGVVALSVFCYGLGLRAIGLLGVEEAGVLSSTPVSLAALFVAGAAGGYAGHSGWFASDAELERLEPEDADDDDPDHAA